MKKILIIQKIHESGIELLRKRKDFTYEAIDNVEPELLKSQIQEFDGIAIRTAKLNSDLINKATKLKIISRHGVGYDNIDIESVKTRNITLAITGTANAAAVAEHVMFMILNISKGKEMYDKCVRAGEFKKRNQLPKVIELWNKKILIAGFGRVGQSLIKRCKGFEMDVYVIDPFVEKNKIQSLGGKKVDTIDSIVADIDYISLHMPINEKTKNMINFDLMKKMKNTCIIINTARGGIISEGDLNKALNENIIYGHRFYSNRGKKINSIKQYLKYMKKSYVILDFEERKKIIVNQIKKIERKSKFFVENFTFLVKKSLDFERETNNSAQPCL